MDAIAEYEKDPVAWAKKMPPSYKNPRHPSEVSLHHFVAHFTKSWKPSRRECIPIFTPYLAHTPSVMNKPLFEQWAKSRLLQFKPGSNPKNVLGEFPTYQEALDNFVEKDPLCPTVLKELYKEGLTKTSKEDQEGEEVSEQANEEEDPFPDLVQQVEGYR